MLKRNRVLVISVVLYALILANIFDRISYNVDKLHTDMVSMSAVWMLGLTLAFNVLNIMTSNLAYCIAMPFFFFLNVLHRFQRFS